jgi:predicted TIM-barrel fold metal-dependent hydrolase
MVALATACSTIPPSTTCSRWPNESRSPSTFTLKFRRAQYVTPTTADLTQSSPTGWPPEPGDGTWKPDSPRLILRGTFDRYPDLTIILGHWGEMLPFWLERVNEISPFTSLERSIGQYVRHNIYVTPAGIFKHHLLQRTIDIIGVDHILFSTDYPFQYAPDGGARRFLETAPIDDAAKYAIAFDNAQRLLRLQ